MNKIISFSILCLFLSVAAFGQENSITVSAGYPVNITNHWLVDKWEKPVSFDLRFSRTRGLLIIGGGINYSKYDVSWFRYYDSDKNSISNLSPYIQIGLNLKKDLISLIPQINLGYSAVITDIEIYDGGKGGLYSAAGLDCNFNLSDKIQLGPGVNYGMIFNKLDFDYEGAIQYDFIPAEDDAMKSLTVNLNLVYRL